MVDAQGRRVCLWCGIPLQGRRLKWCDACGEEIDIRYGATVRYHLRKRDKEICAVCGMDCLWLKQEHTRIVHATWPHMPREIEPQWGAFAGAQSFWEAHHIIPIEQGGGCCGLDNFQTLCVKCHKKTRGDKWQNPHQEL